MTKLIYQLAASVGRLEPDDVETSMMAALLLFYRGRAFFLVATPFADL